MLFITIVKVAFKSLVGNKLRSALTMLGIIIGVGAVIAMLAIGTGAKETITNNIKSMGSNILYIRPGEERRGGRAEGSRKTLKLIDLVSLSKIPQIDLISPEDSSSCSIKYFNNNMNARVEGVNNKYFDMRNYEIEKGRKFTKEDVHMKRQVAIIGSEVVDGLFENKYPIGKYIKIKGVRFKVIGVTKSKGDSGFGSEDNMLIIPYTASMKKITGTTYFSSISLSIRSEKDIVSAKASITKILRKNHRLLKGKEDDFHIRDMTELLENVEETIFTFKLLLSGVAALSLLVGGIGIMNIMFVTVTERTKEIGVRKALGAKNKDILNQFLIEAVVVTGFGGLLGILFGSGSIGLYNTFSPANYFKGSVDLTSIVISASFSIAIGVFFGFYPAFKAAKMNPIDALRYE